MGRTLGLLLVFGLGTTLGPILLAAITAALPPIGRQIIEPKEAEVGRLVQAYQAQLPAGRLFTTVVPAPAGKECGYDPEALFPNRWDAFANARQTENFADYEGYYALHRWRGENEDRGFIAAIQSKMDSEMSRFEAGFLRRCIESTILSSQCMAKVEAVGDRVERFDPKRRSYALAGGHEDQVVCLYADGVAARRGLPLSAPFNQTYADEHRRPF